MRMCVVLAAVLTYSQVSTSVMAEDQPKGLAQLRGSWQVTKSEPKFEPKRLVFDGDKLTIVFDETEKKEATIKIDSSVKPTQIDIVGRNKFLGIYEVSEDTLRICFPKGGKRPTEFKAEKGVILVTLKREKN